MSLVPRDAVRLTGRLRRTVGEVLALPGRTLALVGAAEATLLQVRGLLDRIEGTRAAADELLRRAEGTRGHVDGLLARADQTRAAAAAVVGEIEAMTAQVRAMVEPWQAPLARVQPVVARLIDLDGPQVEALVRLTRRLPELADRVEADVLPLMGQLRSVGPDVHDLLAIVSELDEILGRVPGMGRIKRRVENEQANEPH